MLIFSIIFVSLIILLVFCLSKDTGHHTPFARKDGSVMNQKKSADSAHVNMAQTETLSTN